MMEEVKRKDLFSKDMLEIERRADMIEHDELDGTYRHEQKTLTYPEMLAFLDYFDKTSEKESTEYSEYEMKIMIEDFLEEFRK